MKTKRTIELTVESSSLWIRRLNRQSASAWCEVCGEHVQMVTAEEAARRTNVTVPAIYRLIEGGKIHFLETPDGLLLICVASLA